jgi:hypothetical protein
MNGSSNSSPELPLPMPSPEQGRESLGIIAGIEQKTGKGDGASQGPSTPMPMVDPAQFAGANPVAATTQVSDDQTASAGADDADVIEKEWVSRAKAIVKSTRDDPSVQSKELGKFKAEYIKKRFNKDIKMAKETAEGS